MTNPTIEELAEWVRTREATKKPRQDKNLVAFLSVKSFIQEAIETGYSLLTIWEHLNEKGCIPYSYETFVKHVRRHIKEKRDRTSQEVEQTPAILTPIPAEKRPSRKSMPQPVTETVPVPAPPKPTEATGFTFNSTPKKEDYI